MCVPAHGFSPKSKLGSSTCNFGGYGVIDLLVSASKNPKQHQGEIDVKWRANERGTSVSPDTQTSRPLLPVA